MSPNSTYGKPIAGASVTVAYTGTKGDTTALPPTTNTVRVLVTTDAFIEVGLTPVAVANTGLYLQAFKEEYFECPPGGKVSAIQVSAGGSLYVTPFA